MIAAREIPNKSLSAIAHDGGKKWLAYGDCGLRIADCGLAPFRSLDEGRRISSFAEATEDRGGLRIGRDASLKVVSSNVSTLAIKWRLIPGFQTGDPALFWKRLAPRRRNPRFLAYEKNRRAHP